MEEIELWIKESSTDWSSSSGSEARCWQGIRTTFGSPEISPWIRESATKDLWSGIGVTGTENLEVEPVIHWDLQRNPKWKMARIQNFSLVTASFFPFSHLLPPFQLNSSFSLPESTSFRSAHLLDIQFGSAVVDSKFYWGIGPSADILGPTLTKTHLILRCFFHLPSSSVE